MGQEYEIWLFCQGFEIGLVGQEYEIWLFCQGYEIGL